MVHTKDGLRRGSMMLCSLPAQAEACKKAESCPKRSDVSLASHRSFAHITSEFHLRSTRAPEMPPFSPRGSVMSWR